MKSLERRFINLINKNPNWSTYTCFAQALINQNFQPSTVLRLFNKLVDKDDYDKKDKRAITAFLLSLQNRLRTTGNEGKLALEKII